MKTLKIILGLLLCLAPVFSRAATPLHISIAIPSLGITNADAFVSGLGMRTSDYQNTSTIQNSWLFLVAAPGVTNYNITYQQFTNLLSLGLITYNLQLFTNLFASSIVSPTNGVSSATAVDFSVPEATTNITANFAFTSIINWNPTNYNKAIRHVVNRSGGNLTGTISTGWGSDNNRTTPTTYTVTNNTVLNLFWDCQINQFTNVVSYFAF